MSAGNTHSFLSIQNLLWLVCQILIWVTRHLHLREQSPEQVISPDPRHKVVLIEASCTKTLNRDNFLLEVHLKEHILNRGLLFLQ